MPREVCVRTESPVVFFRELHYIDVAKAGQHGFNVELSRTARSEHFEFVKAIVSSDTRTKTNEATHAVVVIIWTATGFQHELGKASM